MRRLISFGGLAAASVVSAAERPNIIILTADDLGWNDVSSALLTSGNGSKNHQTPNIDNFALQSAVFTHSYTQQNSAPTRAALLTGLYANKTHVYNVWGLDRYQRGGEGIPESEAKIIPADQKAESINPSITTFAELLRGVGYENYIFGKVHGWGGDLDSGHGFNHDLAIKKSIKGVRGSNYYAVKRGGKWRFDRPEYDKFAAPYTAEYIEENLVPFANGNDPMSLVGSRKHLTDALGDCVIDELSKVDKSTPFCFWVCFHAIHSAIVGRDDLYAKYQTRSALDPRHPNYKYAALTEQLDQTVGRILAALEDPNGDGDKSDSMVENTIVIFSSDNGGVHGGQHSNAPLKLAKGWQYEGGVRVPMAVRYPTKIAPKVHGESVHVVDYLPTLAEFAGAEIPAGVDGESLVGLLTGELKKLERDAMYWHFPGYMDTRGEPASMINKRIGTKRYKLRYNYEYQRSELYCLSDDEGEIKNLLEGTPTRKNAKIAQNLLDDLRDWLAESKPLPMYYKSDKSEVLLPEKLN